jgi:hypothetical protein
MNHRLELDDARRVLSNIGNLDRWRITLIEPKNKSTEVPADNPAEISWEVELHKQSKQIVQE